MSETERQYRERDIVALDREGGHYFRHVRAMTAEGLHDKTDIAAELAARDWEIERLRRENADLVARIENAKRIAAHPPEDTAILKSLREREEL